MHPHTITRKTQFEKMDQNTHFTIWVEAPEDITSQGLQHTYLSFIIDYREAFIHTSGLREAFRLADKQDHKLVYISVISLDESLSRPEKDQLAQELLKALLDEAQIRGAYGVFARKETMDYEFASKNGFEAAGVHFAGCSGAWVKILGKPKTATNPPKPLITSSDPNSEFIELKHEPDLFSEATEHEFIELLFVPMQRMVNWETESKVLTKFKNLKQHNKYGFITSVGRDLADGPVLSALIESARRECIDRGVKALIATAWSTKWVSFFDRNGLKNTKIRDNHGDLICLMMVDQATNPPQIRVERTEKKKTRSACREVHFTHTEDLFSRGTQDSDVSVRFWKTVFEALPGTWLWNLSSSFGRVIPPGSLLAQIQVDLINVQRRWPFIEHNELHAVYRELIRAALNEARSAGVSGAYILGYSEISGTVRREKELNRLLTSAGFRNSGVKDDDGGMFYVIDFQEQKT
jgi:hypothetical protein